MLFKNAFLFHLLAKLRISKLGNFVFLKSFKQLPNRDENRKAMGYIQSALSLSIYFPSCLPFGFSYVAVSLLSLIFRFSYFIFFLQKALHSIGVECLLQSLFHSSFKNAFHKRFSFSYVGETQDFKIRKLRFFEILQTIAKSFMKIEKLWNTHFLVNSFKRLCRVLSILVCLLVFLLFYSCFCCFFLLWLIVCYNQHNYRFKVDNMSK